LLREQKENDVEEKLQKEREVEAARRAKYDANKEKIQSNTPNKHEKVEKQEKIEKHGKNEHIDHEKTEKTETEEKNIRKFTNNKVAHDPSSQPNIVSNHPKKEEEKKKTHDKETSEAKEIPTQQNDPNGFEKIQEAKSIIVSNKDWEGGSILKKSKKII